MECQRCGACCKVFGFIEVNDRDKVPDEFVEVTEIGRSRMKTVGFICSAYSETNHEHCLIYAHRPIFCRLLRPGGKLCKLAREQIARLKT